jgi:tRNA modification GTPase
MEFSGIPVILTDTAGLRAHSSDEIERMGMDRTATELQGADIVVWMTAPDAVGDPPGELDSETLWIENKSDLSSPSQKSGSRHHISVKTGQGMDELISDLERLILEMAANGESATLIRTRHKQVATSCVENLLRASALSADQLELMAEALRAAAYDLGRLTGRIDVEEILGAIFRDFCIGK